MEKPNCYECVHRRNLGHDSHSKCNNLEARVRGHKHGVEKGWFMWPVNFDPLWLEACSGFSSNPNDNKKDVEHSPMLELLSLMRYR